VSIDVSFLPALGTAFILVFARIGTMLMLLPGLGEASMSSRMRLAVALALALLMLPLHRAAYPAALTEPAAVLALLGEEMLVGALLGLTARLATEALTVTGSIAAQQLGLGFLTAVDPTQGEQGVILGNFLTMTGITLVFATDLHYLAIAALDDSYRLFAPGEVPLSGDIANHLTALVAGMFRIGVQLAAPFLVFGLLFNLGLGILSRLMPQMQAYFVGVPLSILGGLLLLALALSTMMSTFLGQVEGVMHALAPRG
jgi:flagellar biosynthesis protein FliR